MYIPIYFEGTALRLCRTEYVIFIIIIFTIITQTDLGQDSIQRVMQGP